MSPGRPYSATERERAVGQVRSGVPRLTVARELGMDDPSTVNRWARASGIFGPAVPFTLPTDPAVLGYVAGIFDGEGSLSKSSGRWQVAISNTNRQLLEWIEGWFGGSVRIQKPGTFAARKTCYSWRLYRQSDVALLVEALRPYLIVKAERADEAIEDLLRATTPAAGSA